jgi:hypothetical protein
MFMLCAAYAKPSPNWLHSTLLSKQATTFGRLRKIDWLQ